MAALITLSLKSLRIAGLEILSPRWLDVQDWIVGATWCMRRSEPAIQVRARPSRRLAQAVILRHPIIKT